VLIIEVPGETLPSVVVDQVTHVPQHVAFEAIVGVEAAKRHRAGSA
jgi:hypothetical protein